jgi:phenylacetic acid degradation operon negative regulatory protein
VAPILGDRPAWDGVFHGLLFAIPESCRAYRDALRRAAVLAGFGLLRPGLLVTTDERRWNRIESMLTTAPAASRLLRAELRLAPADAHAAAAEAWPLDALAATYRRQAAELLRAVDAHRTTPPTGPSSVRLMWEVMTPISGTAISDPGLPLELLPADWPGCEMKRAVEAAGIVVGPGVQAYIADLVAASRR